MIVSASTLSPQYMTTAWTSCPFVHYEQTTFSAPFESHPVREIMPPPEVRN